MSSKFHAFLLPWFGFGHFIPFLHLANKLAEKGHKVTYLLPKKALEQLEPLNLFPNRFFFHSLTIPHIDGLPVGTEIGPDIPFQLLKFLAIAMDLTRNQVEVAVRALRPDLIFFDFAYWVPEMSKELGIKSVNYNVFSAATIAHTHLPGGEIGVPPPGYPSSKIVFRGHDAHSLLVLSKNYERVHHRVATSLMNCDVISIRTCKEIEGKFCEYIESHFKRKVLLSGPMLPDPDKNVPLEDKWSSWLSRFEPGSVIFCSFGSQLILEKDQFQELCLGMELSGLPFLVSVKPPSGASTIQEALPEGLEERVEGRGVVWGGWVQNPLILNHPSVGCFVSHCGFGSMWESLVSDCQIVLLPYIDDQILNTRLLTEELEVSVEVEREETGWFSKENLSGAIASVMEKDSELGNVVRRNHNKWREILVNSALMKGCADKFVEMLENLVHDTNPDEAL